MSLKVDWCIRNWYCKSIHDRPVPKNLIVAANLMSGGIAWSNLVFFFFVIFDVTKFLEHCTQSFVKISISAFGFQS